jgi:[ribosomal protein S5]-alanine N-acetyltransferase
MVVIETERLMIRNFTASDWHDFQELIIQYQASESAKFEDPWPTSENEIKGILQWFAAGDEYLAVCLKATGKLLGFVAIDRRKEREERVHNLGYIFDPREQGNGYATEGCRAVMRFVFSELGAVAILTGTNLANQASVRLLGRLGLEAIGQGEFMISKEAWMALNPPR